MNRAVLILTCTAALFQLSASAATYYVSLSGSNTPPYDTWENAATSIQTAVDAAGDGDNVLVGDGTYAVLSEVVINKGVTVGGLSGRTNTIVDGGNSSRCFYLAHSNALIDGFTIQHGRSTGGGGVLCEAGTVQNCVIRDSWAEYYGGGVFFIGGGLLQNSHVYSNSSWLGGGIYGTNMLVRSCVIDGNLASWCGGGAVLDGYCTMVNCSIIGNAATNYGGGVFCMQENELIQNSIVCLNSAQEGSNYYNLALNVSYEYSCTYPPTNAPGNIAEDPGFVDAGGGDYRLVASSPCIDTGTNSEGVAESTDVNGRRRLFGRRVDMGAYEAAVECMEISNTGKVGTAWSAPVQAQCQLQYCSDLGIGDWVDVGGVITATESRVSVADTNAPGAQGGYRLIWLRSEGGAGGGAVAPAPKAAKQALTPTGRTRPRRSGAPRNGGK
ncbi:MAG: choice-of-anchor Q domain-containing protein [Verrucomicrobiota bacterium]